MGIVDTVEKISWLDDAPVVAANVRWEGRIEDEEVGGEKAMEGDVKEASNACSLAFIPGDDTAERAVVSVQGIEPDELEALDEVSSSCCLWSLDANSSRRTMAAISFASSSSIVALSAERAMSIEAGGAVKV